MSKSIPKILITIGDPAGIGPEVVFKSILNIHLPKNLKLYIIGEEICFRKCNLNLKEIAKKIELISVKALKNENFCIGRLNSRTSKASFLYLKKATELIKKGDFKALVTAPLNKEGITRFLKIDFKGHTDFFEKEFKRKTVMLFSYKNFRVSLLTRHIPLKKVFQKLTEFNLKEHSEILIYSLKKLFKIRNPKIGVCGLNPHAGEGGVIGNEEEILKKVIRSFQKKGVKIIYPLPADTIFVHWKEFDCIIALYHDQGLIPFKLLFFNKGVNITLGLPFIRTSPIHGTAFNIVGKNKADFNSMKNSILEALRLLKNAS